MFQGGSKFSGRSISFKSGDRADEILKKIFPVVRNPDFTYHSYFLADNSSPLSGKHLNKRTGAFRLFHHRLICVFSCLLDHKKKHYCIAVHVCTYNQLDGIGNCEFICDVTLAVKRIYGKKNPRCISGDFFVTERDDKLSFHEF
jgi:hypothetical protein